MKISKLEICIDIYVVSCMLLSLFVLPAMDKTDPVAWILMIYAAPFGYSASALVGFLNFASFEMQIVIASALLMLLIRGIFGIIRKLMNE